jgi:methionine-rich copper-binding protein CopC
VSNRVRWEAGARTALALTVLLGGVATAAASLAFHLRLVRSHPAKDAVVTEAPAEVRLWFSEKPQVAVSAIALKGPAGPAKLSATRTGPDSMAVAAAVESPLTPGAYTVTWRTAGHDGHVLRGEFGFTIRAADDVRR